MSDSRPVLRASSAIDQRSLWLWFAIAAAVAVVTVIGVAPLALGAGLIALLVVD